MCETKIYPICPFVHLTRGMHGIMIMDTVFVPKIMLDYEGYSINTRTIYMHAKLNLHFLHIFLFILQISNIHRFLFPLAYSEKKV